MVPSTVSGKPTAEFGPPREQFDIDVDALRAMIPADIEVKRSVIDIVLEQLPAGLSAEQALASMGLDFTQVAAHEDVSWHDYFRVMVFVAESKRGAKPLSVGLREIGQSFYRGVLRTPLGKLLLGRQLGDAVRNMADTWAEYNTLGHVWSDLTSERSFDYHLERFPRVLAESVGLGIFEGTFRYHFMPVTILIASDAPDNAILRMSW